MLCPCALALLISAPQHVPPALGHQDITAQIRIAIHPICFPVSKQRVTESQQQLITSAEGALNSDRLGAQTKARMRNTEG